MEKNKSWVYILLIILFLALIIGVLYFKFYKKTPARNPGEKLRVATSIYPLYFFASEISDDFVTVENLIPAGVEPHEYELSSSDLEVLSASDIVFLNGKGMEAFEKNINDKVKKEARIINTGEGVSETDPHIWLSPTIAINISERIAAAFIEADPAHKNEYEENLEKLRTKLGSLDNLYETTITTCEKKDFVTGHAAFGYLASEYGLNQINIAGISPNQKPTEERVAEIKDEIILKGITYVFKDPRDTSNIASALASETNSTLSTLNPIEALTAEEVNGGENYISLMERNLSNLAEGLLCTLSGKL